MKEEEIRVDCLMPYCINPINRISQREKVVDSFSLHVQPKYSTSIQPVRNGRWELVVIEIAWESHPINPIDQYSIHKRSINIIIITIESSSSIICLFANVWYSCSMISNDNAQSDSTYISASFGKSNIEAGMLPWSRLLLRLRNSNLVALPIADWFNAMKCNDWRGVSIDDEYHVKVQSSLLDRYNPIE